jgi:uncharacterized protein HemX
MPDVVYMVLIIAMIVGFGYFAWIMKKKEDERKDKQAQMKHERKMNNRNARKREHAQLKHELEMAKVQTSHEFKVEKEQKAHERMMGGRKSIGEKLIEAIPETLKSVGNILGVFKKK